MQQRFNQLIWGINFISLVSFFIISAQYILSKLGQWGSASFFQRSDAMLLRGQILEDAFQIGLICFGLILLSVYIYTIKLAYKIKNQTLNLLDRPIELMQENSKLQKDFDDEKEKILKELSEYKTQMKEQEEQHQVQLANAAHFNNEVKALFDHFTQINLNGLSDNIPSNSWDEDEVQNQIYLMESLMDRISSVQEAMTEIELVSFNMTLEINEDSQLAQQLISYNGFMKKIIEGSNRLMDHTQKLIDKNKDYLHDVRDHVKDTKEKANAVQKEQSEEWNDRLCALKEIKDKWFHLAYKNEDSSLTMGIIHENKKALDAPNIPLFS